ncbi:MAG: beta-galactosidase [Prevotella sp.]|nr:beta-galactosidase [Candidatus Prevotella equi]
MITTRRHKIFNFQLSIIHLLFLLSTSVFAADKWSWTPTSLTLNDRPILPVMGEIHFSRVPQQEWRHEIQKMRAGGITILSTYVFWIHHEQKEGQWDWSGKRDLHAFLQICKEENMPVILRIGPFCHGEVVQGGFPLWLTDKAAKDPKNYKLRSTAPGFLAATQRLYSNIFAQTSDMLHKHGGPVIGVQIENESRGPWPYLMALKNMAVAIGFDTPYYTRTGWPKLNGKEEYGKLLPLYGDYADGFWDRKLTDMPGDYRNAFIMRDDRMSRVIATETFTASDLTATATDNKAGTYPYLTCELGGGMMPAYHRRINMSGNEAMPMAICKLGSGSNLPGYYMYHGGTNPSVSEFAYDTKGLYGWAETQHTNVTNYNDMPLMSYDFQCPLGEMGQPNLNAFHQTRLLHQFLADWGEQLAAMPVDTLSEHYARRGCFEFYNDYVRILNEQGNAYVRPVNMPFRGHTITADAQPFCHTGDTIYLFVIKGIKPTITIDGKRMAPKPNKAMRVKDITVCVMSQEKAQTAFKIDGQIHFAQHPGAILYKDGNDIKEEYWQQDNSIVITATQRQAAGTPRTVTLGTQKVAAMPTDSDFSAAAVWDITLPATTLETPDDCFLQIDYQGDCARLYADDQLIMDNFWNGKAMLVRLTDIVGKKIQLRILPLTHEAPIYLQAEQKKILNATTAPLLQLTSVTLLRRTNGKLKIEKL